jgi:hypothetical protein
MSAVGVKGKTYAPFPPPDASLCSYKSFRLFAAPSLAKGYGSPEQLRQGGVDDRSVNPRVAGVGMGPILRIGENEKAPTMYCPANRSNTDATFIRAVL